MTAVGTADLIAPVAEAIVAHRLEEMIS